MIETSLTNKKDIRKNRNFFANSNKVNFWGPTKL